MLVGGHVMIAHGMSRQTGNVDLLVPERWRELWKEIARELGYGPPCKQGGFVQYAAPAPGTWPLDFLIASDRTFDRVRADAVSARIVTVTCHVASRRHLLAMRSHALRYAPEHVAAKYLADAHDLVRVSGRRVTGDEVRALYLKYGTEEIYNGLVRR